MIVKRWVITLVTVMALSATACGDIASVVDEARGSAQEPAVAQTQETRVDNPTEPSLGGTLTLGVAAEAVTLDPLRSLSQETNDQIGSVYSRLFRFASGPDVPFTAQVLEPDLATRVEVAKDGRSTTVFLRRGVRWQDVPPVNGRPFTSADVVATFEAVKDRGQQAHLLEGVDRVEAVDDWTVVLHHDESFAPLLANLASHHLWILPAEGLNGEFDLQETAIGTGPFIMRRRVRGVESTYERNPAYYEPTTPLLDGYRLRIIGDEPDRADAFRRGELDIISGAFSPDDVRLIEQTVSGVEITEEISPGQSQLYVNMTVAPFDDYEVRRAINLAIDRDRLGRTIYGGGRLSGPVPPSLGDYTLRDSELSDYVRFDPERARALLDDAGYPNGFDATMIATADYGAQMIREIEAVIEDLAAVGVNVRLELLSRADYEENRWPDLEYEMGYGPQLPFLEPDEWLREQLGTSASRNWFGVADDELDDKLARQLGELDPAERSDDIRSIQRYALEEVMNPIPVWSPPYRIIQRDWVDDYYPHASFGLPGLERARRSQ